MAEYAPATPQVRAAYVRAMRNAFIASAAEHEAEFDRWLAARDARVKAEALDEASWQHCQETHNPAQVRDMMRARATEYRKQVTE